MFSTLRTRFGIPGVISVMALVFAMLGGAYAASNSSGGGKATASAKAKKGPRGPKGATGPTGPQGPMGPQGPAGAKGDAGANGSNGPTGPTGAAGAKGATGAVGATGATGATGFSGFTATLPSGKTETGTWSIAERTSEGTGPPLASLSFPIPLKEDGSEGSAFIFTPQELENEEFGKQEAHIEKGCVVGTAGCKDTGCRGSVAGPTAPAGVLCVYTQFEQSKNVTGSMEARSADFVFGGYGATGTLLTGLVFNPPENGVAFFEALGTWAVTAP